MLRILSLLFFISILAGCSGKSSQKEDTAANSRLLSLEAYRDAVYASWIGQIVGNTYGLCYELEYIDEPGPDDFPYGYTWTLDRLREYNGAFSDDDTDIEYLYLTQMEEHGIEPNYYQLAEAWKTHIKEMIWCSNRAALTLMHAGHYPPVTGMKEFNPKWCQIDPQLVNEIWAVTAPGMGDYAVKKSEYVARITSDSFGLHPTLHYAAMYSAAFFEKDIQRLIDIGLEALPDGSRFAKIIEHVKNLHAQYPENWKQARQMVVDNYGGKKEYNQHAWPPIDANLNGALGVMALLYGKGDFQKTLDYCCAFGMDADNQAATMCGLLGIIHGLDSIPEELMYPLDQADWNEPFNDHYEMVTREGMENASLNNIAKRIAHQGEKVILAHGGEVVEKNGEKYYKINKRAQFEAPFELNPIPDLHAEVHQSFSYPIYTGESGEKVSLDASDELPPGIVIEDHELSGKPSKPGTYRFDITAAKGSQKKRIRVNFTVHTDNLAPGAAEILHNEDTTQNALEIIRDGDTAETFFSKSKEERRKTDYYGYRWDRPVQISALTYNCGLTREECGWFTSFDVEYFRQGQWISVDRMQVTPEMNLENSQWLKPSLMNHHITFTPVVSSGIRIVGEAGGIPGSAAGDQRQKHGCTSIAELKVYLK